MSAHTPGPWEIDYDTRPAEVCCVHGLPPHGEDKQRFAYVRGAVGYWDADEAENLANIRLIAAAPDLLAEIEREYTHLADFQNNWTGRSTIAGQKKLCRLRDLIAAATGRSEQEVQDDYGMRNAIARATGSPP